MVNERRNSPEPLRDWPVEAHELVENLANRMPPWLISTIIALLRRKRTLLLAERFSTPCSNQLHVLFTGEEATLLNEPHVSLIYDKQLVLVHLR